MKNWAFVIIILSLCGKLMKNFLSRGEKSPLFSPLKFLLSLSLLLVLMIPLKTPIKGEKLTLDFDAYTALNTNEIILDKMKSTIKKSVDTAFPNQEYSLEIQTDSEGVPNLIYVTSSGENTEAIANFITRNYKLETKIIQGEANETR